ncbi:MAG: BatD family protein [Lewinellaceae bacterium]|nr:BatD family protein [Lewinellaceae bacterium]
MCLRGGNQGFNKPPANRDDDLFVLGETNLDSAYLGQQLIYRIVLYTRKNVTSPDLVDLPETDKAYTTELKRFDTRLRTETINGRQYTLKTLYEMAVFPQSSGTLTIDEARIRIGVEQTGALGALLGPQPVVLTAPPVDVLIKPLPIPAPENFTGGIGHFNWNVSVDKTDATTDDAITLSINIQSNSDGRRFSPPLLTPTDGLEIIEPKLRVEDTYENGEELVHNASFDYIILPHKPGDYSIAPKLMYFNPDSNRYLSLQLPQALHVNITDGKDAGNNAVLDSSDISVRENTRFWKLPNWLPVSQLLFGVCLLLALLSGFMWWRGTRRGKRQGSASGMASEATERVVRLPQTREIAPFYEQLYQGLQVHFCKVLNMQQAEWSQQNLAQRLVQYGVAPEEQAQILALVSRCEQILYAGQTQLASIDSDRDMAARIFRQG